MTSAQENKQYTSKITINHLDDYSLSHVFHYLPPKDKLSAEKVCKKWQEVSRKSWNGVKKVILIGEHMTVNDCEDQMSNFHSIMSSIKLCKFYVRHLELFTYTEKANRIAENIIIHCKALQTVKLHGVSRKVITNLAKKNKDLREVYLRDLIDSCDDALSRLFRRNRKLRSLELISVKTKNYGKYVLDLPIETLEHFAAFLSHISVNNLIWIFNRATKLLSLGFDDYKIDEKCMREIGKIRSLNVLQFGVYLPFLKNFECFINLKNLQKIDFSSCDAVTDNALNVLSSYCCNLAYVNISGCQRVTDNGIHSVATLPRLEYLLLNYLEITDNAFRPMPELKELDCYQCKNLSNEFFINILISSRNLKLLNTSYCKKVNNRLVDSAVVHTSERENSNILKLFVGGTRVRCSRIRQASPNLQVILDIRFIIDKLYVMPVLF